MSKSPISNPQSPISNPQSPVSHFAIAWGLLTALPLPFSPATEHAVLGRATGYFPLVGLVLGGILAGVGWGLYRLLPPGVAAVLVLAVWVGLTGMLHLDGFMDSCDGLLPPRDPARRLEIMKDSRVGAFGVVGGVLLLLLKFNGLAALSPASRLPVLVLVPILARWMMAWVMARYPLARPGGMGRIFREGTGWPQIGLASAVAVPAAFLLADWRVAILLLAAAWLTAALVARLAVARIRGLTGDVYGAICEAVEAALLIVAVAAGAWF